MMVVFFVGIGLAAVSTGFAQTPLQVGIGLFVIGMFAAIYHPVGLAMVTSKWKNTGMRLAVNGVWGKRLGKPARAERQRCGVAPPARLCVHFEPQAQDGAGDAGGGDRPAVERGSQIPITVAQIRAIIPLRAASH